MRSKIGGKSGANQNVANSKYPQYHPSCSRLVGISESGCVYNHFAKENVIEEYISNIRQEKLKEVYCQTHTCHYKSD